MKTKQNTKTVNEKINKVKTFINELQSVQESYFNSLVDELKISDELNEWLFDFIYNEDADVDVSFTEYIGKAGKTYEASNEA
jgi:hemerythrin